MSRNSRIKAIVDALQNVRPAGLLDSEDDLKRYTLSPENNSAANGDTAAFFEKRPKRG